MLLSIAICMVLGLSTVLLHQTGLLGIAGLTARHAGRHVRLVIPGVLVGIFGLHLLEIATYAGAIWLAADHLHLGQLRGDVDGTNLEFLYFSAETFTTLGFGDILPTGPMRLIASFEPLNGMLLLGWSASFVHLEVDRYWRTRSAPRAERRLPPDGGERALGLDAGRADEAPASVGTGQAAWIDRGHRRDVLVGTIFAAGTKKRRP
ncbi:MAG: potassium channel family protein [Geminicoccaceae bacterium]